MVSPKDRTAPISAKATPIAMRNMGSSSSGSRAIPTPLRRRTIATTNMGIPPYPKAARSRYWGVGLVTPGVSLISVPSLGDDWSIAL